MDGLPMCVELEIAVGSRGWLDMMVLYCRKSAAEDREVALRFNRLCGDRIVTFKNRMAFVHELENVTGVSVVAKTIVFLKEMMEKEDSRDHLENLENEAKQRALEIVAAHEDRRTAMKLNKLREEILIVCEKRRNFTDELKSIRGIVVVGKAAEFGASWYAVLELLRSLGEDYRIAREINKVALELNNVVTEKDKFLEELESRSLGEDYTIAREINRVPLELNNVVTEKDRFLEELDSLGVRVMPAKTAEFMREIQAKDKETVDKLRILQREMELNARKKELFIEKLKGIVPIVLVKELEEVRSMIALAKAAEILRETQLKDDSMMAQLQYMEMQMELRTIEKELFIQKLLHNVPF
ncbi:hypothetical protein Tco_0415924 [Tanacetum coccineum]